MKAILEFNLPEDQSEYDLAINGIKYYSALSDIREWLRRRLKYESELMTPPYRAAFEEMQEEFFNILQSSGVEEL